MKSLFSSKFYVAIALMIAFATTALVGCVEDQAPIFPDNNTNRMTTTREMTTPTTRVRMRARMTLTKSLNLSQSQHLQTTTIPTHHGQQASWTGYST